jgi:hypothetical protein
MLFAAVLTCALGAPAASALPLAKAGMFAPGFSIQVKAKAKTARAAKGKAPASKGKCAPGAICPLVGGGDY